MHQNIFERIKQTRLDWKQVAGLIFILLIIGAVGLIMPGGEDWTGVFLPATEHLLAGQSPYNEPMFFSPVWVLIPFIPLAFLPLGISRSILFIIAIITYSVSARKLGAKNIVLAAFLLSPPVIFSLWLASNDWMPILGFVLPPQIGLFFVLSKPQMGSIVTLFWFVETCRKGGMREIIRVFAPVTIAFLLTFLIFGMWPLRSMNLVSIEHNASFWPVTIPIGLGLLVASLRKRKIEFAMAAGPCLSPYLMFPSWVSAIAATLNSTPEALVAIAGTWIFIILRAIG
jgi:hypothetical protein